jgi:hypothetical protein
LVPVIDPVHDASRRVVWKEMHVGLEQAGVTYRAVLLYSSEWFKANEVGVGDAVMIELPEAMGRAEILGIFNTTVVSDAEGRLLSLYTFRGRTPPKTARAEFSRWPDELHPDTHRGIRFFLDKGGGDWTRFSLLRSLQWMETNGVRVGEKVFIDLPDMGVSGQALVLAIEPCPELEEGDGDIVTGHFEHSRALVGELRVEGESKPIMVTPSHPFWSEDRKEYVEVSDLRPGERLSTRDGITRFVSYTMTGREERVYNIEVHGSHCYRVGDQGLLVHNASVLQGQSGTTGQGAGAAQQACDCTARLAQYRSQSLTPSQIIRTEGISNTAHYLWWLACSIAHTAGVRPRGGSTPVVAVALVCEAGSKDFKMYVSYNLKRGSSDVQAATEALLGTGHWIPPQPPLHSEENLVNYFQSSQPRGDLAGVAASRCICLSCVTLLSTGNQLASPRGIVAVPTCNANGTPAITQARQWCSSGSSPIPFNQQF